MELTSAGTLPGSDLLKTTEQELPIPSVVPRILSKPRNFSQVFTMPQNTILAKSMNQKENIGIGFQIERNIKSRATQNDVQGNEADPHDLSLISSRNVNKKNHHHHNA